jgi:hypothetical protein
MCTAKGCRAHLADSFEPPLERLAHGRRVGRSERPRDIDLREFEPGLEQRESIEQLSDRILGPRPPHLVGIDRIGEARDAGPQVGF